jgi:hypothetical protein
MVNNQNGRKCPKSQQNKRTGNISRLGANTPFSFTGHNMTPFGGIFALRSLTDRLGLEKLLQERLTVTRRTVVSAAQYIMSTVNLLYVGYERLAHVQYVQDDPFFKRVVGLDVVPRQSGFWRFFNKSINTVNELEMQEVIFEMRDRVWAAAGVGLSRIHIDTDTTVETVYGDQQKACVGYNPAHRGKKSYQPVISAIAETGEFICGRQRGGETISGADIAAHLHQVFSRLPSTVMEVISRTDSGFYCKEAVEKHEEHGIHYIGAVKKYAPIQREITQVAWSDAKGTDGVAEFYYQPGGWKHAYRFVVARYRKEDKDIQTDMFEDTRYKYRVFVTDLKWSARAIVAEYDGRAQIENLIEEGKNQVAMAKVPGKRFTTNALFLQLVILTFNLNKWLQLIGRDENAPFHWEEIRTSRFKHLYVAGKLIEHGHGLFIRFAADYPYKEYLTRLLERVRRIVFERGAIQSVIGRSLIPGST